MRRIGTGVLFFVWAAFSCNAHRPAVVATRDASMASFAIRRVDVFDGEKLLKNQDVRVENGAVTFVGPTGTGAFPASLETMNGEGKTLMPGLWDSHVHIGNTSGDEPWAASLPQPRRQLEALLYAGITHILDGGREVDSKALQSEMASGVFAGPVMLRSTRLYTAKGGHPLPLIRAIVPWPLNAFVEDMVREVSSKEEGAQRLREDLARENPDFVKLVYNAFPDEAPRMPKELLGELIREVHAQGRRASVHVGTPEEAVEAAELGADVLMHVPWNAVLTEEQASRVAKTGVLITTTRRIYSLAVEMNPGPFRLMPLEKIALPDHPGEFRPMPKSFALPGFSETFTTEDMPRFHQNIGLNLKKLHAAQAVLLAGTDSSIPGVIHGGGLHRELESLVALGIPPEEVLAMATSRAARLLGKNSKLGVVQPGAVADLLLIEGNPVQDITATRKVLAVWKEGREVKREALPK